MATRESGERAQLVATYRLNSSRVELWQGDALAIPADFAIFGRNRKLRGQLEAISGKRFEPDQPLFPSDGRRFSTLSLEEPSPQLPWRLASSLDYHPRNGRIDARQTPPFLTHIDNLVNDLWLIIGRAMARTGRTGTAMMLPLSWRNAEVIGVAQVLAVWVSVVNTLPEVGLRAATVYRLVDLTDVSPFRRAIEDDDRLVTRHLRVGLPACMTEGTIERWGKHRFVPDF